MARDGRLVFPRANRLTRGADLEAISREGKRIRTTHLDVRVLAYPSPSELVEPRVGIVVPRHRHTAVDRNRLKRRLRELVRLDLLPRLRAHPPVDIAIRARRDAYEASLDGLRADIVRVRQRLAGSANPE